MLRDHAYKIEKRKKFHKEVEPYFRIHCTFQLNFRRSCCVFFD